MAFGPTDAYSNTFPERFSDMLLETDLGSDLKNVTYEVTPVFVKRGIPVRPWETQELQARITFETLKAIHHDMTEFIGKLFVGKRKAYVGVDTVTVSEKTEDREVTLGYVHTVVRPNGRWGLLLAAVLPERWQHLVPRVEAREYGRTTGEFAHRTVVVHEIHREETWWVDPFISTRYPDVMKGGWQVVRVNAVMTREAMEAEMRYRDTMPPWMS